MESINNVNNATTGITGVNSSNIDFNKVNTSNTFSSTFKEEETFITSNSDTQAKSVYNYTMSLEVNYNNSKTSEKDTIDKLEQLIELLMKLNVLMELLEILKEALEQEKDSSKENPLEDILAHMNSNISSSFSYTEVNTEVEMSAEEFTQIMDHMNSSELYKGLSYEEKIYKMMDTASSISEGSLYSASI